MITYIIAQIMFAHNLFHKDEGYTIVYEEKIMETNLFHNMRPIILQYEKMHKQFHLKLLDIIREQSFTTQRIFKCIHNK